MGSSSSRPAIIEPPLAAACRGVQRIRYATRRDAPRSRIRQSHNGLISTLRNFTTPLSFTTPAPYCSAIRPLANLRSSTPSTVLCPLRITVNVGPWAVIS